MSKYNVAVLGPIPRDHITTHQGEVIEKFGCAMHTAIGLSNLLGEDGTVHLVSHLRKKDEAPVKKILADYVNINVEHITSEADQGDVVHVTLNHTELLFFRETEKSGPLSIEVKDNPVTLVANKEVKVRL